MELIEEQEFAIAELLNWEDSKTLYAAVLTGFAGTGKTTVIAAYVKRSKIKSVVVSAPTHKAKEVIGSKLTCVSETLQALLGLRPNTDLAEFNINSPQFSVIAPPKIFDYKLVIIDECSMINEVLYNHLLKTVSSSKIKLIFAGDALQLPPVKEEISHSFLTEPSIALTTIHRQKDDNPILGVIDNLRYEIIKRSTVPFYRRFDSIVPVKYPSFEYVMENTPKTCTKRIGDGNLVEFFGYSLIDDKEEMVEIALQIFGEKTGIDLMNHAKYLAWTNKKVDNFNNFIRHRLFGDNHGFVCEGDVLTGYRSVLNRDNEIILVNSKDYIVKEVGPVYDNVHDIACCRVKIMDYTDRRINYSYIDIVVPAGYPRYVELLNEYLQIAYEKRGAAWMSYFNFQNSALLLEDVKNTYPEPYTKKPTILKKSIGYGYACTVHKSQGSTYDYAIVNYGDISLNRDIPERLKLIYVALTRAAKCSFIYKK